MAAKKKNGNCGNCGNHDVDAWLFRHTLRHMTTETPRAHCPDTGWPLFAVVDSLGLVIDVQDHDAPGAAGERVLPLFGNEPRANAVTEIVSAPSYCVSADRVARTFTTRPKTAAELLAEISWWFAAVHSRREAVHG